jgi:CRP-like cAMP-binding protein
MSEKLWQIKNCELFGRLSAEQIQHIESRSRSRTFPARSPIYLPSEKADSVFLLAKGLVKVSHLTADGKESILAFVEPGELFGELAIFEGQERDEYVEALEASTVVMIPADEVRQLMAEHTDAALGITKMVGLRRHRIERRLKNLLFLSNRDRLVHLLLDLAEQFGLHTDEGIRLRIKLSHQELGNLIGSTRETVTVLMGQLKSERAVDGGRRKIILTDPQRLARSVSRQPPSEPRPSMRLSLALAAG